MAFGIAHLFIDQSFGFITVVFAEGFQINRLYQRELPLRHNRNVFLFVDSCVFLLGSKYLKSTKIFQEWMKFFLSTLYKPQTIVLPYIDIFLYLDNQRIFASLIRLKMEEIKVDGGS